MGVVHILGNLALYSGSLCSLYVNRLFCLYIYNISCILAVIHPVGIIRLFEDATSDDDILS